MRRNDLVRRHLGHAALAMAATLLVGCDSIAISGPHPWPEDFRLDGFWAGEVQQGRMEMSLVERAGGDVSGAGAWIPRGGSRAFRVEGVVSEADGFVTLLLELSPTGHTPGLAPTFIHYRARPWGHQELRGRLNGGGFDDAVLVLRRGRATTGL